MFFSQISILCIAFAFEQPSDMNIHSHVVSSAIKKPE